MKRRKIGEIRNRGNLMTTLVDGKEQCLGDLIHFAGIGIYDPTWGKIDVTLEEANAHNTALDAARIKGLDENCKIGQGGNFYLDTENGMMTIKTWLGTKVSDQVQKNGQVVTFKRNGRKFRGRASKNAPLVFCRRIA